MAATRPVPGVVNDVVVERSSVARSPRDTALVRLVFAGLCHPERRDCPCETLLGGVPFDFRSLWGSPRLQATLAITWTAAALLLMVSATRMRESEAWTAGSALLSAAVITLFLVDLAGVGTVPRILSFVERWSSFRPSSVGRHPHADKPRSAVPAAAKGCRPTVGGSYLTGVATKP